MNLRDLDNIALPEIKEITGRISYVPASVNPLSSDIGIVRGDSRIYLYDVGSTVADLKLLHTLPDSKAIVISHFHGDHTWWLTNHTRGEHGVANDDNISTDYIRPVYSNLYVSALSANHCSALSKLHKSKKQEGPSSPAEDTRPADISVNVDSAACRTAQDKFPDCNVVGSSVVIEDGVRLEILPIPCTHCKGSLMFIINDEFAFLGDCTYPNKIGDCTFYNAQLVKAQVEVLESVRAENFLLSHDQKFIRPKRVVLRQLKSVYDKWDHTDHLIRL